VQSLLVTFSLGGLFRVCESQFFVIVLQEVCYKKYNRFFACEARVERVAKGKGVGKKNRRKVFCGDLSTMPKYVKKVKQMKNLSEDNTLRRDTLFQFVYRAIVRTRQQFSDDL
jgi:hypothetical protein